MAKTCSRRTFLGRAAGAAAASTWVMGRRQLRGSGDRQLLAGEATVDTTPPVGIEMAGFHRPAGQERRIKGIRQPAAARALVLRLGETPAAVVSLDICGVSAEMTARVQRRIARQHGIPALHVRLCATHTHSMPTFRFFRQWGAISPDYMASVEDNIVLAVGQALADLAPAALYVGKCPAPGASNNRTTKTWKTEGQFTEQATHDNRWLDTMVHVLHFERAGGKQDLLWYHFAAHPVCYQDEEAGPDWPGLVAELIAQKRQLRASYLQGHAGDVNAGDAEHWIGKAERTAEPVAGAISQALDRADRVRADCLRVKTEQAPLMFDMARFARWLAAYRADPSQCAAGHWVDARFAKAWYDASAAREANRDSIRVPLTAMQLGQLGFLFHPSELYSYYGLAIQRDSPLAHTIVVGYCDDIIGYLPDPKAFEDGEYSAITVPKILDLPPFQPTAAADLTQQAIAMLRDLSA